MGVRKDFSDIDKFFDEGVKEVVRDMAEVGETAVEFAKANGNYKDHTGRLRASNYYEARPECLVIGNDAPYASNVESKGYEVCASAALYARDQLKKRFEK